MPSKSHQFVFFSFCQPKIQLKSTSKTKSTCTSSSLASWKLLNVHSNRRSLTEKKRKKGLVLLNSTHMSLYLGFAECIEISFLIWCVYQNLLFHFGSLLTILDVALQLVCPMQLPKELKMKSSSKVLFWIYFVICGHNKKTLSFLLGFSLLVLCLCHPSLMKYC